MWQRAGVSWAKSMTPSEPRQASIARDRCKMVNTVRLIVHARVRLNPVLLQYY